MTARVVLFDAAGRAVQKGGHEVRVWMVGKGPTSRAAAVDVTDMRNGTYVASLPVLWGGETEVRASLVRPREFRRVLLTLMEKMKMMNQVVVAFVSGGMEEVS